MPDVSFSLNGQPVTVTGADGSLLDTLRTRLGITPAKRRLQPAGQCGCCTVLVDGQLRAPCVTPVGRVRGREVTTFEGLEPAVAARWTEALCATGGTQCGFCTPGIATRLAAVEAKAPLDERAVHQALLAHLCRCTGWQTIAEAALTDPTSTRPRSRPPIEIWRPPPGAPSWRVASISSSDRRSPRAEGGSPTTLRRPARSSQSVPPMVRGRSPRRSTKRGARPARCRGDGRRRR
ncbi:MAG: 2Fe-2S iron-sulfur cluster-binding protein [Ilumatobacteraceae bacterium]